MRLLDKFKQLLCSKLGICNNDALLVLIRVLFVVGFGVIIYSYIASGLKSLCFLIASGLVVLALLWLSTLLRKNTINYGKFLAIASVILLIVQVFVSYSVYATPVSDANLMNISSDQIVLSGVSAYDMGYFRANPNNTFLLGIFVMIKKLGIMIGMPTTLYSTVFVGVVLGNLACVFTSLIIKKITDNTNLAVMGFAISSVFVGLSGGLYMPYSDSYAVFFTNVVLLLYVYLPKREKNYINWLAIFAFSFIGMLIKPTVIIVLIAIICIEVYKTLKEKKRPNFIYAIIMIFVLLVTQRYKYIQADILLGGGQNLYGSPMSTPFTHYLMMGMNDETIGSYSVDDSRYTASFTNQKDKMNGNLAVIKQRLTDFGVVGYTNFLAKKLGWNYSSGTFTYDMNTIVSNQESFYAAPNSINEALRVYYYSENSLYFDFYQVIWRSLLVLTLLSVYKSSSNDLEVIQLSIIGISIFTLVFEGSPKYLFIYSTYYIICAVSFLKCVIEHKTFRDKNDLAH